MKKADLIKLLEPFRDDANIRMIDPNYTYAPQVVGVVHNNLAVYLAVENWDEATQTWKARETIPASGSNLQPSVLKSGIRITGLVETMRPS